MHNRLVSVLMLCINLFLSIILIICFVLFQVVQMEAKKLLHQFLYTLTTFLYINGDSENGHNNVPFAFFPPQRPPQSQIFVQKPVPKTYVSKQMMGNSWPYFQGPGMNSNVLIRPMLPRMVPGGGYVGPGHKTNIVLPPIMPGPVGGPVLVPVSFSGNGPLIQQFTGGQFPIKQQRTFSQGYYGKSKVSPVVQGASWKGFVPKLPGVIPSPKGVPFQQIPSYGYYKPAIQQQKELAVLPKPPPLPQMSLPIPGQIPAMLKQSLLPADPVHGLPLNHLYVHVPVAPPAVGMIGGMISREYK